LADAPVSAAHRVAATREIEQRHSCLDGFCGFSFSSLRSESPTENATKEQE
jgi:hypothetical protein